MIKFRRKKELPKTVKELAKDLTQEPPRSPYVRVAGFATLGRVIDVCRASIAGTEGAYYFNNPIDQKLFEFKEIDPGAFHDLVETAASDEEIGAWVRAKGAPKTDHEIECWSEGLNDKFGGVIKDDTDTFGYVSQK